MGCDIHAHIEVMIAGQWHHYSCPPIQRHYGLFARICGVRGDKDEYKIVPPRGLPNNLSVVTQVCYLREKPDAHSETWLTRQEFVDLIAWVEASYHPMFQHHEVGYLTGNGFSADSGIPPEIQDIRFICWFDN